MLVVIAAVLQIATATTFVGMSLVAYLYGSSAQRAAEDEVVRQGQPADALVRGRVNFEERGVELMLPLGIALLLSFLAAFNLSGVEVARITTWVVHLILCVGGGFVTAQQVFASRFIRSAFERSGDAVLPLIDVGAMIDSATGMFPSWFRVLVTARFVLVTAGSVVIMVLVALPSASSHYS
jgi:hypothetical protein